MKFDKAFPAERKAETQFARLKSLAAAVIILSPSFFLTACHRESAASAKVELPAVAVTTIELNARPAARFELLPGTVVARQQARLEAKVTGRVTAFNVEPGSAVEEGEVLVEISAPEIAAKVEQARAAFELAGKNHQRVSRLFEREAATRAEFDSAVAQLEQTRAAVEEAESLLAYIRVTAPFAGVVASKPAEVGDLASPGRVLLTIESPDRKQFAADVPESLLLGIALGSENRLVLGGSAQPTTGKVAEINPAGDPGSRSWLVKWDLPADVSVRSGTYGQVQIATGETSGLMIPASAIVTRGQLEQVHVVADGRAVLRLIKTGERAGDEVRVLAGLELGDRLITSPAGTVRDGQRVNP